MPSILDKNIDLSLLSVATYTPAVTSGLTSWSFLFGNAANVVRNLAPGGAASTLFGAPTINAGSMLADYNDYVQLASPSTAGSETIYCVYNPGAVTKAGSGTGFQCVSTFNGTYTNAFQFGGLTGFGFFFGYWGYLNASSVASSATCNIGNNGGSGNLTLANASFYALKIDLTNLVCSITDLTLNHTASVALPAGSTKPAYVNPFRVGGYQSQPNQNLTSFVAKYSRATLASEDALVYAQVKTALAAKGIAI